MSQTTQSTKSVFPFDLVANDIALVEKSIAAEAEAFDPKVAGYLSYICSTSGKRIRPALAVLAGAATSADGCVDDRHRKLGVVLELIHMATLVHDDIIDGANVRREIPTANFKWGNSLSVLLGDALFSHALMLATEFNDLEITRAIGLASREVCQGEIIQTQRRFDMNLGVDDYFQIIRMKTGALFSVATELAARLSGAPQNVIENMREYGMNLGTAYQIYDDCLDLVGDESVVGKTLRTDLEKGKLTLPILNLMNSATENQRAKLNKLLLQKEVIEVSVLAGIADYEGAIDRAISTARSLVDEARANLIVLADSKYSAALNDITRYLETLLDGCRN